MISFPSLYEENMKKLLGDEQYEAYLHTFERNYWQGLRVNTAKISVEEYKERCSQELRPVPWCPTGFYLTGETKDFSYMPITQYENGAESTELEDYNRLLHLIIHSH